MSRRPPPPPPLEKMQATTEYDVIVGLPQAVLRQITTLLARLEGQRLDRIEALSRTFCLPAQIAAGLHMAPQKADPAVFSPGRSVLISTLPDGKSRACLPHILSSWAPFFPTYLQFLSFNDATYLIPRKWIHTGICNWSTPAT